MTEGTKKFDLDQQLRKKSHEEQDVEPLSRFLNENWVPVRTIFLIYNRATLLFLDLFKFSAVSYYISYSIYPVYNYLNESTAEEDCPRTRDNEAEGGRNR